ncbi:MAG: sensor histidine kinase [Alphaproteobacteria bacterium]|jgi:Na+/proline symporter|nr:ATP-binding protein [Candidatus Jidaibacter sp.]
MNTLLNYTSIDQIIVLIFLILTLLIGVAAGRNIKTVRDYAIANKMYGVPVLVLTLLATMIGADSTTGMTAQIFADGIIFAIAAGFGSFVSLIILAHFISSKFDSRFDGMISISDVVGYFYGNQANRFSGFIGYFFCIGIFSAQLTVMGHLAASFLGIDYFYAVAITSLLVVAYSTFGGIRAVAITDVFQFAVLIVIIPIIANVATNEAGGLSTIFRDQVLMDHGLIYTHPKFDEYFLLFMYWCLPFAFMYPSIIQRYLMTHHALQAKKITYIYALLVLALALITTCIAFSALELFPNAEPKAIIPIIINELLPVGIKGLAISGMLAVIMSTADSALNSGGILIAHNFFYDKKFSSEKVRLSIMKLCTLISGVIATYIASKNYNISVIILMSQTIFISVSIPLTLALLNFRANAVSFWICTVVNIVTLVITHVKGISEFAIPMICTATSLIAFIFAVYFTNDRNLFIDRTKHHTISQKVKLNLLKYLPTLSNIVLYSTSKVKKIGAPHITFGIFCCVNYVVPFFMWTTESNALDYPVMISLRIIAGFLCVGLLLKEFWPQWSQRYFPLYWHFTLMFCLSFLTTIMFLIMHANIEWLINVALAIMLLAMLVDWVSFVIISVLGIASGWLFHSYLIGAPTLHTDFQTIYLLSYVCIFASAIGIIFARRKELNADDKLEIMQVLGGSMAHEAISPFSTLDMNIDALSTIIKDAKYKVSKNGDECSITFDKLNYDMFIKTIKTLKTVTRKGIKNVEQTLTSIKSCVIADDVDSYNLAKCAKEAVRDICTQQQKRCVNIEIPDSVFFKGSYYYMKHVFINLIKNSFKYGGMGISIRIYTTDHTIIFQDTGAGISDDVMPHIFERFFTNSTTGTGIGLSFCKMVIEDMEGYIDCESEVGEFTRFTMFIPSLYQEVK